MTIYDFAYLIGMGFSFLLAIIIFGRDNAQLPQNEQNIVGVVVISLLVSITSWAFPIFCIIFKKYFMKNNNKENV